MIDKMQASAWEAAEHENRYLRDERRRKFWNEIGINPAKDTSDVSISPSLRIENLVELIKKSSRSTEVSPVIFEALSLIQGTIMSVKLGAMPCNVENDFKLFDYHPSNYRNFFISDSSTAYEISKIKD